MRLQSVVIKYCIDTKWLVNIRKLSRGMVSDVTTAPATPAYAGGRQNAPYLGQLSVRSKRKKYLGRKSSRGRQKRYKVATKIVSTFFSFFFFFGHQTFSGCPVKIWILVPNNPQKSQNRQYLSSRFCKNGLYIFSYSSAIF